MKTYIINLPERTERLEQTKAELEKYGITDYEVFEAIKHTDGRLGIYLTLYKLIEQAYFNGEDYIAVYEDDVEILGYVIPGKLVGLIYGPELKDPQLEFDIFYLGCNTHDPKDGRKPLQIIGYNNPEPETIKNNTVLRVLDAYGCHAMILSRQGMFKILRAINKNVSYEIGVTTNAKAKIVYDTRPIDVLIQQEIQPDGKCYCTNPIITTQRSGYSDIEKKEMNQDYIVTRFNENVKNLFK